MWNVKHACFKRSTITGKAHDQQRPWKTPEMALKKSRAIPSPEVKKHFGKRVSPPVRSWCPRELWCHHTPLPLTTLMGFKTDWPLSVSSLSGLCAAVSAAQVLRLTLVSPSLLLSTFFFVAWPRPAALWCIYLFLLCGLSRKRSPRSTGHGWAPLLSTGDSK